MKLIQIIKAGEIVPKTLTLDADEILLLVILFLVLFNAIFLLVMKYKYTVRFKNRKLREFIDRLTKTGNESESNP